MNLTPPKPITLKVAKMAMPDPVPGYVRERADLDTKDAQINERAEKIHTRLWREMKPEHVAYTLRLAGQESELYEAIANLLRQGKRQEALNMLTDWIDNDLWDRAQVEAMKDLG